MGPDAHISRSISDVSSFSIVSVLSFDPIRVRALCVEEPVLGWISSGTVAAQRPLACDDSFELLRCSLVWVNVASGVADGKAGQC